MEIVVAAIISVSFAYVAKKLETLETKVDRLQEEIMFIHHVTRKRVTDYNHHEEGYDDGADSRGDEAYAPWD